MMLAGVVTAVGQHISASGSGDVHLELWQLINLIGAPLLALLFAQPVIDDLAAWISTSRSTDRGGGPPPQRPTHSSSN